MAAADGRGPSRAFARNTRVICGLVWSSGRLLALSLVALMLVSGVVPTATVWVQRQLIDGLVPPRFGAAHLAQGGAAAHGGNILGLAVFLGILGLFSVALPHARRYAEAELQRGLTLIIQDRVYQAINSFPGLSRFESPAFSDKIRLVQQVCNGAASRFASGLMNCGQSLVTAVGMFVTLEVISPILAAFVGFMAIPAIAAQIANSRRSADLEWRRSPVARRQMFYSRLLSDKEAAKEVRVFGLGDFLRDRMVTELRLLNRGQRGLDRRIFLFEGSLSVLAGGISAGGLIWVVGQTAAGRLPVGDVSMFAMAVVSVQGSISNVVSRLADVYKSVLLLGHYTDVVSAGPDLALAAAPLRLPRLGEGIEFRDVWFRYDESHPWVLQGVSLVIPRGRSAALIGLNGAGKTTLVKLLCRLYDPDRGSIRWDGVDIRDVAPEDLRRRIGTVFQDFMTYDLTATENIGLGDIDQLGNRQRICRAAEQAGVHDKLSGLPRGYDTMLSRVFFSNKDRDNPEAGVLLSGGEWQRLAVARGLMRADRDLLILDEPSSGLDAEAEHAIHQRLCAMREGRTSLLISHRLGSVRDADVIFVLSRGRIAEQGTHRELMAAEKEYHRLFMLQARGYQREDEDRAPLSQRIVPGAMTRMRHR
jgi:ATP-binding cassette, subfamily B, bacterial